jgi:hypothetical protein
MNTQGSNTTHKEQSRAQFEAAVIERFKESGCLEVEIRMECLGRAGDGYADPSVDAYWHFWQLAQAKVEVKLEPVMDAVAQALGDAYDCTRVWAAWGVGTMSEDDFHLISDDSSRVAEIATAAIEATGMTVAP